MAKQRSQHPFTGKMGGTIGYQLNGEFLERENGNKEGKQFRRDPNRKRTMECAYAFGAVSKVMKLFYRNLSKEQRKHGVFGTLTGKATTMVRTGKTIDEVLFLFQQWYVVEGMPVVEVKQKGQSAGGGASAGEEQVAKTCLEGAVKAVKQEQARNGVGQQQVIKAGTSGAANEVPEAMPRAALNRDSTVVIVYALPQQTVSSTPVCIQVPPPVRYVLAFVQAPVFWRSA